MNKKSYIILFIIIAILIVGSIIFISFNKNNDKEDKKDDNKTPIVDIEKEDNDKTPIVDIEKDTQVAIFPKSDDTIKTSITLDYQNKCQDKENCKIINPSQNFKNEKITEAGMTVETSCNSFIDDEYEAYCDTSTVKIDDKIIYNAPIGFEPGKSRIKIIKTEDNYIIEDIEGGYQNGKVTIYDKNGKVIKTIENTATLFLQGKDMENSKRYEGFDVTIKDNIMYYATTDNYSDYIKDPDKYDKDNLCINYVHFYYMDLVTLKNTEISKTCAHTSPQIP